MTICRGQLGTSGKQLQKCNILRQNVNFKLSDVTALQEEGFALLKRIKHSAGLPTRSHPWSNRPASEGKCKREYIKIGGGKLQNLCDFLRLGLPRFLIIPKLFVLKLLHFHSHVKTTKTNDLTIGFPAANSASPSSATKSARCILMGHHVFRVVL